MSKKSLITVADYEVGYGKAPKETRFKKGQSGNPNGRPRGAKTKRPKAYEERLKKIIYDEAYRNVPVHEEHGVVHLPLVQAIVRSAAVKGAKGDPRSQKLFLDMLNTAEKVDMSLYREHQELWITYKSKWEEELERREQRGITGPDPLPHPDHINVDWKTGEVTIWGPLTRKGKEQFEMMVKLETEINLLKEEVVEATDRERIEEIGDRPINYSKVLKTLMENWKQ